MWILTDFLNLKKQTVEEEEVLWLILNKIDTKERSKTQYLSL